MPYDPRVKLALQSALEKFLYDPVNRKHEQTLEALIAKNSVLCGHSHMSFRYKGKLYQSRDAGYSRVWNSLHPSLVESIEEYLASVDKIRNHELPHVMAFINRVLSSSRNYEDYLWAFPELLHPALQPYKSQCLVGRYQTDEYLTKVIVQYEETIEVLKKRMVINLIT